MITQRQIREMNDEWMKIYMFTKTEWVVILLDVHFVCRILWQFLNCLSVSIEWQVKPSWNINWLCMTWILHVVPLGFIYKSSKQNSFICCVFVWYAVQTITILCYLINSLFDDAERTLHLDHKIGLLFQFQFLFFMRYESIEITLWLIIYSRKKIGMENISLIHSDISLFPQDNQVFHS